MIQCIGEFQIISVYQCLYKEYSNFSQFLHFQIPFFPCLHYQSPSSGRLHNSNDLLSFLSSDSSFPKSLFIAQNNFLIPEVLLQFTINFCMYAKEDLSRALLSYGLYYSFLYTMLLIMQGILHRHSACVNPDLPHI